MNYQRLPQMSTYLLPLPTAAQKAASGWQVNEGHYTLQHLKPKRFSLRKIKTFFFKYSSKCPHLPIKSHVLIPNGNKNPSDVFLILWSQTIQSSYTQL